MPESEQGRPVWADREAKGKILEDLTEKVLRELSVPSKRNRVNGKGVDFYSSFNKKRGAIESKHWGKYEVGFSCVKKEIIDRFKGVRRYRRIIIASYLNFKSKEADKIEKSLEKAKIKVIRLGFEITDRRTWRRAYRTIRRVIIRLFGLKRFLRKVENSEMDFAAIAGFFPEIVLKCDAVKGLSGDFLT